MYPSNDFPKEFEITSGLNMFFPSFHFLATYSHMRMTYLMEIPFTIHVQYLVASPSSIPIICIILKIHWSINIYNVYLLFWKTTQLQPLHSTNGNPCLQGTAWHQELWLPASSAHQPPFERAPSWRRTASLLRSGDSHRRRNCKPQKKNRRKKNRHVQPLRLKPKP